MIERHQMVTLDDIIRGSLSADDPAAVVCESIKQLRRERYREIYHDSMTRDFVLSLYHQAGCDPIFRP
jgi:hypothetical protein